MDLWQAPFQEKLRVVSLEKLPEEERLILIQLGVDAGELLTKVQSTPLQEPVCIQIGEQIFAFRKSLCRGIGVEVVCTK